MLFDPLGSPPLATADLPGIGGRIKQEPEDFEVEEIPAYEPCGEGPFLYLWVQKRDMGAEYFQREIARRLDIGVGEVGTAGLKDRRAVTRQWVSVPAAAEARLGDLSGENLQLLDIRRHTNKLKPGHLHGNRFRILVRDVLPEAAEQLPALIQRLLQRGLPNFYGKQRFGRDGETVLLGLALLGCTAPALQAGRPPRPPRSAFLRKLALSAAQAAMFNHYLARRMEQGQLFQVIPGDVMAKWPAGGLFRAENLAVEQARFEARATVHTGPIYGRKTFAAGDFAAAQEAIILAECGISPAALRGHGKLLQGTRRHNLIYFPEIQADFVNEGVWLQFTLPAGSYATSVLRELQKSESSAGDDEDSATAR